MSMPFTWQKAARKMLVKTAGTNVVVGTLACCRHYLQDHVAWQKASISGDDPLPVDILDQDANQGCLVATDNADGKWF